MRTNRALRTLAAALLASGALTAGTVATAGPAVADNNGTVWGTVVSHSKVNLRADPNTGSPSVGSLPPGARERIECATFGSPVDGNPYWYWLGGSRGWASGAYMKPEQQAPMCDEGRNHHQNQNRHHDQNRDHHDQPWDQNRHHDQNRDHHDQPWDQNQSQNQNQHWDPWDQNRHDTSPCQDPCQCQDTCQCQDPCRHH